MERHDRLFVLLFYRPSYRERWTWESDREHWDEQRCWRRRRGEEEHWWKSGRRRGGRKDGEDAYAGECQ